MKTKLTFILITISIAVSAQVKLRTDNFFQVGSEAYGPLTLGYYTSGGVNNGTWSMEWWDGGFNIWKPWPSPYAGNYKLFIEDGTGNVGIGRRPTAGKLDVAGDIAINGIIKLSSDARLKTNVVGLTDCMQKLNMLNGKSYYKKMPPQVMPKLDIIKDSIKHKTCFPNSDLKTETNKTEFGFLAQELKDVFPELVQKDSLGYLYIDYIGLIPVIVEALKEQKETIDVQDAKIQALEKLIKASSSSLKSASIESGAENIEASSIATLGQNSPNPFDQSTTITYYLPASVTSAFLYIYNMNGLQLKKIALQHRGNGSTIINGYELQSGMYLYSLVANDKEVDTKRMLLTK